MKISWPELRSRLDWIDLINLNELDEVVVPVRDRQTLLELLGSTCNVYVEVSEYHLELVYFRGVIWQGSLDPRLENIWHKLDIESRRRWAGQFPQLAKTDLLVVRRRLAEVAEDQAILQELSREPLLRSALARNPHCPRTWWRKWSTTEDYEVLLGLAKNPGVDIKILWRVARKLPVDAKFILAEHPKASAKLLYYLAQQRDPRVDEALIQREDCPEKILLYLSRRAGQAIREALVRRQSCPPSVLRVLFKDPSLRALIVQRKDCPDVLLEKALKDKDARVRALAYERRQARGV